MIKEEDIVLIKQYTLEQGNLATDYLHAILHEDFEKFKSLLCREKINEVKKISKALNSHGVPVTEEEQLQAIFNLERLKYLQLKEDYAVTTSARYDKEGRVYIYFLKSEDAGFYKDGGAKTVFPIQLDPELEIENESYVIKYKVNIHEW